MSASEADRSFLTYIFACHLNFLERLAGIAKGMLRYLAQEPLKARGSPKSGARDYPVEQCANFRACDR
jgi:hypothetical protein